MSPSGSKRAAWSDGRYPLLMVSHPEAADEDSAHWVRFWMEKRSAVPFAGHVGEPSPGRVESAVVHNLPRGGARVGHSPGAVGECSEDVRASVAVDVDQLNGVGLEVAVVDDLPGGRAVV